MKKAFIFMNYANVVVLKDYLEIIKAALEGNGYFCEFIDDVKSANKDSIIVYPMAIDAFKYYFKGFRNFIVWQQGATGDESYMRHHSRMRRSIINHIDTFVMKKSKFILFVSECMRNYYENMAKTDFHSKSYVMPCFNEDFDEKNLEKKDFSKKVFAYVGSLDLWQCFEKTAKIFSMIEKEFPDSFLKVLTFQTNEAVSVLQSFGVKNYLVKSVPKNQVKKELVECSYGFVIRENNIVNRVATPTKISSYLAAGVLPVYSECLVDFTANFSKSKSFIRLSDNNAESVLNSVRIPVDGETAKEEIREVFRNYYSRSFHIKELSLALRGRL